MKRWMCMVVAGALSSAAMAGEELPREWSDTYEAPAPTVAHGRVTWGGGFGKTVYNFGRLDAGMPFYTSKQQTWSFGANVSSWLHHSMVPGFWSSAPKAGALRGELWFSFYGPARASRHALVLAGGGAPSDTDTYFLDPRLAAYHVDLGYDGYVSTRHVDVSMSVRVGVDFYSALHAGGSVAATWKVSDRFGVQLGVEGGVLNWPSVLVGVRGRPVPFLELAAGVHVQSQPVQGDPNPVPLAPSVEISLFDGRGGDAWRAQPRGR